jgi:hypothetical protein
MKRLASLVSAPFARARIALPGLPPAFYLAVLLLPGGLLALPFIWWLGRPGRKS